MGGFPKSDDRYRDPEETLAGRCLTCGTIVKCHRRDAVKALNKGEFGAWGDLLSAECPGTIGGKLCRARVFLLTVKDFLAAAKLQT